MKAVIIEDEAVSARRMARLLEVREFRIIATLESTKELSEFLDRGTLPEVFFMDIHLSDGVVFELLNERQLEVPIIFTTAYDQYAIRAFKQNSIDYLLKPIDETELDQAIIKLKKIKPVVDMAALTSLLSGASAAKTYKERFSVKVGDKIRSFNIEDLSMFYSADKINYLMTREGRAYPIDYSIEQLSGLVDPKEYYRVNRGYLVSISAIRDVIAYSNSRLKVIVEKADSHEIIVSREKVKTFKEWLG